MMEFAETIVAFVVVNCFVGIWFYVLGYQIRETGVPIWRRRIPWLFRKRIERFLVVIQSEKTKEIHSLINSLAMELPGNKKRRLRRILAKTTLRVEKLLSQTKSTTKVPSVEFTDEGGIGG